MKLIVAGASGFVATEVIRQSLKLKEITAVVALARKPVAVTPTQSKQLLFDQVRLVCQAYTMAGLQAGPATPFRFVYMSGINGERDQTKRPFLLGEYCLMRGETENQVLAFAAAQSVVAAALRWTGIVPAISVEKLAAGMLSQVVLEFDKEPLLNDDLKRIGRAVLDAQAANSAQLSTRAQLTC